MNRKIIFSILIIMLLSSLRSIYGQTRLGILHTEEELTIWRQRAQSGPYKTMGDVSTNSPGDWTRIQKNADVFMLNPNVELTNAATFKLGYETEPNWGHNLRDAAFVSLILRNSNPAKSDQYAKTVKNMMMIQSRKKETDFTKYAYFGDMAGWVLAGFMTDYLFAYDYIKDAGVLTNAEKDELNRWFYNSANFFSRNLHVELGGMFKYRLKGDYSDINGPAETGEAANLEYTHVNADGTKVNKIYRLHKWYNNRRAAHVMVIGLVDVFLKNVGYVAPLVRATGNGYTSDATLEAHAKAYIKEWIKYSVFPDGMQGEFERSYAANPFKGFNYSTCNLFAACIVADAYARRGDFDLYSYTTSEGLWGTQGGNKSIRLAVESHMNMVDGTKKRYFNVVTENNRYQNVQALNHNQHYVSDVWYTMSNVYWKSGYQKGVYTRKGPGTLPYPIPTKTGSIAGLSPWGGLTHVLPAMLFMYGQMEGKVWPYPSSINPIQLPVPVIAKSGSTTLCEGEKVTLSAPTGYTTYIWSTGATTKDIIVSTNGAYTVKVKDQSGNVSPSSAAVNVTVNAAPVKPTLTAGGNVAFDEGGSVVLQATTGAGYSYSWYKDNSLISTATTSSYTATTTGTYTVLVSQNGCASAASLPINVHVTPPGTAFITYDGSLTLCGGSSVVLKSSTGSGYVYQWQKEGVDISNATESTFTATQGGKYTVSIIQNNVNLPPSNEIIVTTTQLIQAEVTAAGSTKICGGAFVALKATGGTGFTYQWKKDGVEITNATSDVYEASQGGSYTVVVTQNACGNSISNAVNVEVMTVPAPVITASGSTTLCEGSSVMLQVPTGGGFSYRWKRNGMLIPNANAASYQVMQSGDYTVDVTVDGCQSGPSNIVKVTVNDIANPAITYTGSNTICEGGLVTLQATTGNQYIYQWKKNGVVIPNATHATYVATQSGKYTTEILQSGCISTISNTIEIINASDVKPAATITTSNNTPICEGSSVVLQANSGSNLTYQWRRDGVAIPNATTATFQATETGEYTVKVTLNNCSSSLSAAVRVSVIRIPKPTIYSNDSYIITKGQVVVLNTNAVSGATYQWKKEGIILPNATSNTYSTDQTGRYTVQITKNACTSAISDAYILSAKVAGAQNITTNGKTIFCEGSSVKLSAPTGYQDYQWSNGDTGREITVQTGGTYSATASKNDELYAFGSLSVTIINVPDKPTIARKGEKLLASSASGYQWILNGEKIAGATQQEYKPTSPGTYSVRVNNTGGCSSTSDVLVITTLTTVTQANLKVEPTAGKITAYPNPSQGVFNLSAQVAPDSQATLSVISSDGKIFYERKFSTTGNVLEESIDISFANQGIYLIKLQVGTEIIMKRIMKE